MGETDAASCAFLSACATCPAGPAAAASPARGCHLGPYQRLGMAPLPPPLEEVEKRVSKAPQLGFSSWQGVDHSVNSASPPRGRCRYAVWLWHTVFLPAWGSSATTQAPMGHPTPAAPSTRCSPAPACSPFPGSKVWSCVQGEAGMMGDLARGCAGLHRPTPGAGREGEDREVSLGQPWGHERHCEAVERQSRPRPPHPPGRQCG